MPKKPGYLNLSGTSVNDVILADFNAVDALHFSTESAIWTWNRKVVALGGDDTIIRDRPGDYKPDPYVFSFDTGGHVAIHGGPGTDTIDYSLFEGSMEIDLRPMGQDMANTFSSHVNSYFEPANAGFAKATGLNGQTIYGQDFLFSIENVIGTDWNDKITGTDGDNDIEGRDGEDTIYGEGGNDNIDGGDDADKIHGGAGFDVINGGAGGDKIWGEEGGDVIHAGSGKDRAHGGEGIDIITGGTGGDKIWGGDDGDILFGDDNNDTIHGDEGDDQIFGGAHKDKLYGDDGADTIWGGSGNDSIWGGQEADTVYAEDGNDRVYISGYDTLVDGGAGFDTIIQTVGGGNSNPVRVVIGPGGNGYMEKANVPGAWHTELKNIEAVKTKNGDDIIEFKGFGNAANKAWGGGGNDEISLGSGDDSGWGGDGNDLIRGGIGADFIDGGAGNDDMRGGSGDDHMLGKSGDDTIFGASGDDSIWGGSGADEIRGGKGDDEMEGGLGADVFIWEEGDTGLDVLKDFELGTDVIDIDGLLANPPIALGQSYVGKVAALPTSEADTTGLYALTDNGWMAFAWIEGYDTATMADAIATGELFGKPSVEFGVEQPLSEAPLLPIGDFGMFREDTGLPGSDFDFMM